MHLGRHGRLAVIEAAVLSCAKPPVASEAAHRGASATDAVAALSAETPVASALHDGGVIADDPGRAAMTDTSTKPAIGIIDASAVRTSSSYDMAAARASKVPTTVTFRLDGPPAWSGIGQWKQLLLHGLLENAGELDVTITVFPTGPFGFFAQPSRRCAQRKPLPPGTPPLPMQAPPPPLLVELPARTAVRVTTDVDVERYDWVAGVAREIEWSMQFWNEPKPKGTVAVP